MPKKHENRGGAGRPRQGHKMLTLTKQWAQVLDVIYDENASTRDRLAAIKLWKACTMVKLSED